MLFSSLHRTQCMMGNTRLFPWWKEEQFILVTLNCICKIVHVHSKKCDSWLKESKHKNFTQASTAMRPQTDSFYEERNILMFCIKCFVLYLIYKKHLWHTFCCSCFPKFLLMHQLLKSRNLLRESGILPFLVTIVTV